MQKKTLFVIGILCVILAVASMGTWYVRDQAAKEKANEAAGTLFGNPDESPYVDAYGNTVNLEGYLGQILIVNSWASWSPFSVQELQDLNELAGNNKDGVVVIAINRKENKDQAERFLATLPPLPNIRVVIDTKDYFYGAIGGYAMPETAIYNKVGTIVFRRQGAMTLTEMNDTLQNIKAEQDAK